MIKREWCDTCCTYEDEYGVCICHGDMVDAIEKLRATRRRLLVKLLRERALARSKRSYSGYISEEESERLWNTGKWCADVADRIEAME